MTTFGIVQILGAIAVVFFIVSYQQKKKSILLLLSGMGFVLLGIQYYLTGAYTGVAIAIIIIVRSIIFFCYERKNIPIPFVVLLVSILAILVVTYFTWQNIFSILPVIGSTFPAWGLWQSNMTYTRRTLLLGTVCFLIFNFISGMYTAIAKNIFDIISLSIAIWRYDYKGKGKT